MTVRPAQRLVVVGIAAITAHVLDDSFVHLEPGASPRDHVVGGLAPTIALVAAAWAYRRLRRGARAALATGLGLLGLVAGGAGGGYHLVNGGLADADFTGLLALLGGLLLTGLGVAEVWKSRRLDESRRRRYLRRSLVGVAALVVFVEVVFPILFAYGYTHFGRPFRPHTRLVIAHKDVSLETDDGLKLSGWYVPSKNGAAVVVLPAGGRSESQEHVGMLARHGYGVLTFDPRGTGESEGDPYRWRGVRDVEAALAYLRSQPDVDPERIGGLGLSLGGELMLEAAGETKALKAVVSEGAGIRSIREHLLKPGTGKWLTAPFWAVQTAATAVFSNETPPPNLRDLVARISPRPVFLICSGHPVGGEELNEQFYAAAGEPKTLWRIADAHHTAGLDTHPAEYEQRVIAFFDRALLPSQ